VALIGKLSTWGMTLLALLVVVGCTSSTSPEKANDEGTARHCAEPQNPYDEGSGHYAGYEWAEKNNPGTCGGRSQSFIEGCEEYQQQESEYEDCEAQGRK
jgi:hypothetical protein